MLDIIERPSPNWNERVGGHPPDMVILHYTGMASGDVAIARLCDPVAQVSSHYVIDRGGVILRLVADNHRAWHAGVSSWHGATDINSRSIGIELVNPGHAHGYIEFAEPQMVALLRLLADISTRHHIAPERVLAHSDIAPGRKCDPGERFDWERLFRAGFGLWTPPDPMESGTGLALGATGSDVQVLQRQLARLGFGITDSDRFDKATETVVRAFQRHWRPQRIDGRADASTLETLKRLNGLIAKPS